jgi:hypothetical protein
VQVRPRKRRRVQAVTGVEIDVDDQAFDTLIKEASDAASALENAYVLPPGLHVFSALPICTLSFEFSSPCDAVSKFFLMFTSLGVGFTGTTRM